MASKTELSALLAALPKEDLPDRLGCMTVKELRQGLRQPFFVYPFLLVHLLAIGSMAVEWNAIQSGRDQGWGGSALWVVAFAALGILMPLRGFDALRDEQSQGNNELLVLAGLTRWQIVRGKCAVQLFITALTLMSLLPYVLARYFIGAFSLFVNAGMVVGLLVFSFAVTCVVIAASGYKSYVKRFAFLLMGLLYVAIPGAFYIGSLYTLGSALGGGRNWMLFYGLVLCLLVQLYLAVVAMQVGRGHLKLYLRPWESPPTSAMTVLFFLSPAYLLLGSLMTAGVGAIPVVLLLSGVALAYDRAAKPRLYMPYQLGNVPATNPRYVAPYHPDSWKS
jgi:ABC-type transport system involved in multi-copper enzyme maturation permease subunit